MKKLVFLLAYLSTLLAASQTNAAGRIFGNNGGSCGTAACAPTYYAPQTQIIYRDVITPVAYPVPFSIAVPVVSYFPNAGATYAPVFAAQPNQSAVVTTSTTSASPGQMMTRAEWSDSQLDSLIDKLEKRLAARQQAAGNQQASVPNVGSSAPPPVPSHSGSVDAILKTNCAACHTGAAAKKKVMIFDENGNLNANVNRQAVWDAADTGRMPPAAQKDVRLALTDADVSVLRSWMLSR